MADANDQSGKSSKRNKRRAQKRSEARIEKIKQDGVIDQILELEDPIMVLKMKLQQAKDNKDHKRAAEIRHQIWIEQDKAAGCRIPDSERNNTQDIRKAPVSTELSSSLDLLRGATVVQNQAEVSSALTSSEKRLRNLKKKLQQIHILKDKRDKGEELEETQIKKLETEDSIVAEIQDVQSTLAGLTV